MLTVTAVSEESNLSELLPGQADGLTWEACRAQYGMFDLVAEPERPFAPGGECWLEFYGRVRRMMDTLAEQFAGRTAAAVTHAGFIVVTRCPPSSTSPAPVQGHVCTWTIPR
jgi:broad specificity phosphatase PhoE